MSLGCVRVFSSSREKASDVKSISAEEGHEKAIKGILGLTRHFPHVVQLALIRVESGHAVLPDGEGLCLQGERP
jgi:hypothetical protein